MQRADLITACDQNLVAYLSHLAQSVTGGTLLREDDVLLFAGAHDYPGTYTNGVIRTGPGPQPAPKVLLDRADEFFSTLGRGYMLWVRAHADDDLSAEAQRRGWWRRPPAEGNAGLAIDHPLPEGPPLPAGVRLRRVQDATGWMDYRRIAAVAWQLDDAPEELLETMLFSIGSLRSPDVDVFVAYANDRPVAGCMGYFSDGVAGLQWTGTLPAARGQGLGAALFRAAGNAGFARGARAVVAVGSGKGTPIWVRMGFEVVTRYVRFLAPPVPSRPLLAVRTAPGTGWG